MKKLYSVLLLVLCIYAVGKFCHKQTDGFQITKIHSSLPVHPEWNIPTPGPGEMQKLEALFSQPFYFLGSGGQCYAFVSHDGQVVLKLFKMHHLRQYPFLSKIPLPGFLQDLRNNFLHFQKQRLDRIFSSSYLAYHQLKEETGLLYLNLNPSSALNDLKVTLVDRLDISHVVKLEDVPFALQLRADNAFQTLRFHLKRKDLSSAKNVALEIVSCLKTRYEKGIQDTDPALRRNLGLLKNKAIFIDIGSFLPATSPHSQEKAKEELIADTKRMRKWLKKRSPELTAYFDELIANNEGSRIQKVI